jgi:hypothetical protein
LNRSSGPAERSAASADGRWGGVEGEQVLLGLFEQRHDLRQWLALDRGADQLACELVRLRRREIALNSAATMPAGPVRPRSTSERRNKRQNASVSASPTSSAITLASDSRKKWRPSPSSRIADDLFSRYLLPLGHHGDSSRRTSLT